MAQFKAQAHMQELQQRLTLTFQSAVFTLSYDANFFPLLEVVNAGETQWIYITTEPDDSSHVNALGLPQQVYSPHQCALLRVPNANTVDTATREKVMAAIAKLGMKILDYEVTPIPSTPAAALAAIIPANLVFVIKSDEINPETQSQ
jgi:hypothetical protein